jgi:hypothetical protein
MASIAVLVLCGGTYLFARFRSRWLLRAFTAGTLAVVSVFWLHPPLQWFGGPAAWRTLHTILPLLFLGLLWTRGRTLDAGTKFFKRVMFVGGLAAFTAFLIGGFVREKSRQPYTVYGHLLKPEATMEEMGQFLLTDRCFYCHPGGRDFERVEARDWDSTLRSERRRPGVRLSDSETEQLLRYLKERYP